MNFDGWQRVQLLLEQALALPPELRSAFVESTCAGEVELRDEVLSLLAISTNQSDSRELDDLVHELPTVWLGALAKISSNEVLAIHKCSHDVHTLPTEGLGPLLEGGSGSRFVVGSQVGGRYSIRSLLGQGGMGDVYEAWDEELLIPVALKTLRFAGRTDEARRRLKLEGFLARSVWHPNVCRLYDVGGDGDGLDTKWFLTMELLRGETLSKRLGDVGRLSLDQALAFAQQLAEGIGAAHHAGVVHRDFKTSNVMLVDKDRDEHAVIMDFGIARAVSSGVAAEDSLAGGSDLIIGTPAYMAPEQLRGEEVGPAADIYSLGLVLYEMVTGSLPFAGSSTIEMARKRLLHDAPSPRSLLPDLDDRWEAVILRCLTRDPKRRFGRAEEIGEALGGRGRAPAEVADFQFSGPAQHTLPVERDDFVGRERELEELAQTFADGARLVTLVGAGGMGKTRLAVRYGSRSRSEWPGGVWFCDFTETRDLNGIVLAVARSLGIHLGKEDPVQQIGHAISSRGRCLVVLDNFEKVTEQGAVTLGQWLERASNARFLVTSREKLSLGNQETVQEVEPLPIESGVKLFAARARRLRPGLNLSDSDAAAVQEIVRLVDGMPLAIELAGARMRVMGAPEIVAQMKARFRLLTGGGTARHETLEVAIDGSWELLRPWEKEAWAQCSLFEGGFTLEAAEGVLDLGTWPEAPWVVDVVQSLVDKSLLRTWVPKNAEVNGVREEARFGMFASLQEYALGKLKEEGTIHGIARGAGTKLSAEKRHGKWFAACGTDEAVEAMERHGGVERRWRLLRELDNLVAACRRAVTRDDGEIAAAAYQAAWAVLDVRGPFGAAVNLGQDVLKAPLSLQQRGRVLTTLGQAEWRSGRIDAARDHYGTALAIHRESGDRRSEGMAILSLGILDAEQSRMDDARVHYEAALAIHREVGNRFLEGRVLTSLGNLHREQGHLEKARVDSEAALAIHREFGNRRLEGLVLGNLAILHFEQGRIDEAHAQYEAALAIHREIGDRSLEATVLGNLAILHLEQGRIDEAHAHYGAALAIHRELGYRRYEGVVLGNLGYMHFQQGRIDEAQVHYQAALAIHREVGDRRSEAFALANLGDLLCKEGRKDEGRLHLEAALAVFRELGQMQLEGKILIGLANLHYEQGQMEEARCNYEAALAIQREVGDRRNEGAALSRLGSIYLQQDRIEDAWSAVASGEKTVRQAGELIELAILLCVRGELEYRTGNTTAARATLDESQAIFDQVQAGHESTMGRSLTRLRRLLS